MTSPAHALRDKLCIQTECTFDEGCMCLQAIKSAFADAAAENGRLRAALKIFVGCAYPVATEINPRGHAWRPEKSLDYALSEARAALGSRQAPETGE
jgi:hypothetical protein